MDNRLASGFILVETALQMSRRHKRSLHRHRQTVPPAQIQKRPAILQSQKWIVVSVALLSLVGAGLVWQSNRPKPASASQTTALNPATAATKVSRGTTVVPSNAVSLFASSPEAPSNPPKPDQAATQLNQQANKLMSAGDVTGAIRLYEKALTLTPEDEDLHYNLGIAYAKASDFSKAEVHYREALRLLPDYAEVHNNLGNLLLRAGRWDEAAEQLDEAIKLQPEYAAAYNNLGIVRQKQKRLQDATACFQKAVQCDTNYLEAHFNLASAAWLAGNRERAASEFQEALRIDPTFEAAQLGLAKALQK
jgi:Tfp pilus assembly protein PilF